MASQLSHRGPDDSGVWIDAIAGIGLGHTRLAIVDLSSEGHQPMHSVSNRFVIVFNGEIYNFKDLRLRLERAGHLFRGHSDTEVLLSCISEWGVARTLERLNGMFAFAVWDKLKRTLHLARDRVGEKPLYYGWLGDEFVFASELKALRVHPRFDKELNRHAIALYVERGFIPSPLSILEGISKLPPGCTLAIHPENGAEDAVPVCYWRPSEVAQAGLSEPFRGSEHEAREQLDVLLHDAVSMRMEADVPLGAFLSGGIDSSTMVALMQSQTARPVKTFTIGFCEAEFDEAVGAKRVARYLGTEHTELYVTAKETAAAIPKLPELYDEPFADPSQVPTFLVSQLARQDVTVVLSGDGGDELFAGYKRYLSARNTWNFISGLPQASRSVFGALLARFTEGSDLPGKAPYPVLFKATVRKAKRIQTLLALTDRADFYDSFLFSGVRRESVMTDSSSAHVARQPPLAASTFIEFMRYQDLISYLPDDILVKVDRASMGVSLEVRVPFLDHRVIEFAWTLPETLMVRRGAGKHILRQVLHKHVPAKLFSAGKRGFSVPIAGWLRGPLREWAETLLSVHALRDSACFRTDMVRQKWSQHLSGSYDWHVFLWNILMFQAWFEAHRHNAMPMVVA